jgi:hypothetical protein
MSWRKTMEPEVQILVVDIQRDATATEAEKLLNEPLSRGYYLQGVIGGWDNLGARGFFRLRVDRAARRGADVGGDVAATAMLKAHSKLSCRELSALLKEHGIKRSKDWVAARRREMYANLPVFD